MDWKSIIADLQREGGYTQAQLAELCGCSQPSINALAMGKVQNTRHHIGAALIEAHGKLKRRPTAKRREPARRRQATAKA